MDHSIVKIQDCCETCKRPHSFERNKRYGLCDYLAMSIGDMSITRFSWCRFYLRDADKFKEIYEIVEKAANKLNE